MLNPRIVFILFEINTKHENKLHYLTSGHWACEPIATDKFNMCMCICMYTTT